MVVSLMPNGGVERHNAATRKLYDKSKNAQEREFRGVDGEGGNVPDPNTLFGDRHQYLTLRAGPDVLETGQPLEWYECFAFLADLPRWYIYVAYFFDYDVTMMIRGMPEERARRLVYRGKRFNPKTMNIMPLDISHPLFGSFEVDYLPHKEFKVRRKGQRYWTVINDTGQFFQKAFLDTITKWNIGTQEEREFIRKEKMMRADFTEVTDETRAYNAVECLHLELLMTEFREICLETGYVPKKWQGPGNLASAMLEKHGVPRREAIPILSNSTFRGLAQAGYYGGRFETTTAGPILDIVYQYDINGAYVHLLRSLPCLIHGSWKQSNERPDSGSLWFGKVHYDHDAPRLLYNLPHRLSNGNIRYQKEGIGVYWSTEIEAAERAGTRIDFREGWIYEPHCDCRWFDFVDAYYAERLALGKTTKGYVLKLAGNSVYGKIAQSIGYAPWANPVWAGLITAGCRAMLIDAYRQAPDNCLMLATDGLFMTKPLDLPVSTKLGEWDETVHPNGMFIVQPGIYFLNEEVKTRGIERGKIHDMRPLFEQQWTKFVESHGLDHTVSVPVTNFITAKQALARNKWKIAGTWEKTNRELSFNWSGKRISGLAKWISGNIRTLPYLGGPDQESVPYDRLIGGGLIIEDQDKYTDPSLQESARMAEQPDWVQPLFD
jgi:hypothetical protein